MKIEVCILAGGQSQRMGQPKGALRLEGSPLLDWSKRLAHAAGFPYRVIARDLGESVGPISGIETALKTTRAQAVLFLSCDMPFVRGATLRALAARATETAGQNKSAIFARSEGRFGFPFLLRKQSAVTGDSLQALAKALNATALPISDDEAFNINTPEEFAEAQRRLAVARERDVLDVDALGIRRGDVEILKEINWTVRKGEHWTILGANGSGKTSLLSALTGYLSPTTGRIRLLGQEFGRSDWRELRKHIGIVSSSVRQLMADAETALETVASGTDASIDRWGPLSRKDRARALDILKQTGCEALERRVWAVLSQGERQRVLIGRALMANPEALILDEPCAGLDPAAREHFLDFLQRLIETSPRPAIILVTHHVEEIVPGLTHVMALKRGEIAAQGPKGATLNSKLLSEIFSCEARLRLRDGRYNLSVRPNTRGVMA